jgi:hypothetical protein
MAAATLAVPVLAFAYAGPGEALSKLERGRWLVHSAARGGIERSVCLGEPALLLQVEHGAAGCAHEWVRSEAAGGAVQYTCPGRGFGRTELRIETSKVATIDTQGLVDGRPFAYRATARKVSEC